MIRRRLVITGRVQNVFYRAWFVGEMRGLGIRGWVRNRADSSVEAVIEGPTEMVDHRWVRPADMLEKEPAIKVMGPALHIMKQLSPFNTVSAVLDWARQLGPVPAFMPVLVRDENGRIHARLPSENPSAAKA